MTPSSLNNLTDAEVNERIAVACGWHQEQFGDSGFLGWVSPNGYRPSFWRTYYLDSEIPKYSTSLNAMAEAEATLDAGNQHEGAVTPMRRKYRDELAKQLGCAWYQSAKLISATAKQRADAFLATIAP